MSTQERYTFEANQEKLTDQLVILTGVARSGTTILGKLLASLNEIDYDYEPWFLAQVPVIERARLIDSALASELLEGNVHELFTAHLLGRGLNVRPTDDSKIWNYKTEEEIKYRWNSLKSRDDAKNYAEKNHRRFAMKMVNLQPSYPFLYRTFPKMKLIHILRNPLDVALSIQKKKWFSDHALENVESLSIRKEVTLPSGKKKKLPWWVRPEDVEKFLGYSEFSRGLCCWRTLMEQEPASLSQAKAKANENYFEVRYEELISNPVKTLQNICQYLGASFGVQTEALLATVDREKPVGKQEYPLADADKSELERVYQLMKQKRYKIPENYVATV